MSVTDTSAPTTDDAGLDRPGEVTAEAYWAARGRAETRRRGRLAPFARWETLLVVLLAGVLVFNLLLSPYFWDGNNILDDTSTFMEIALLALPVTLIIIAGHIDLSIASTGALCAIIFATTYHSGWNVWAAAVLALVVGVAAGLVNGVIVTALRLPSLVVTLGTYALYRGIANGLLGSGEISSFPSSFAGVDTRYLPGTHIPAPLVLFTVCAVAIGLLLHVTVFGRYIYAAGSNEEASRYSGVAVDRIVIILFALSGFFAALAALVLVSRLQTARSDIATGDELQAITAAVLGGANIFGGEGSVVGTVLAVFIIGLLGNGMTLDNVPAETQTIAIGSLLILSILLPTLTRRAQDALARRKGGGSTS